MKREKLKIGQQVLLPAKDIVTWEGDEWNLKKKVRHQKESIMYVRELHNPNVAGLSYTMDTPPERSYGILYEVIEPLSISKWLKWKIKETFKQIANYIEKHKIRLILLRQVCFYALLMICKT